MFIFFEFIDKFMFVIGYEWGIGFVIFKDFVEVGVDVVISYILKDVMFVVEEFWW